VAETELASELTVSRGSVRKAIGQLIAQGLLVQVHGRGTFVSAGRLEQPLADRLVTFSEDLIAKGIPFETHVLETSVGPASQRVASLLSLSPEEQNVLVLKRVRNVAGSPLIYLINHVAVSRCPGIERVDFSRYRLVEALEEVLGLDIDWARRTFEAQCASKEVAELLALSEGCPVMYMEQVLYLRDGSPIELSDLWLRGDRFRLSAIVTRRADQTSSEREYR